MTQVHQDSEHPLKGCLNTTQEGMSKVANQERQAQQKTMAGGKKGVWGAGSRKGDEKRLQKSESDFSLQAKEAVVTLLPLLFIFPLLATYDSG